MGKKVFEVVERLALFYCLVPEVPSFSYNVSIKLAVSPLRVEHKFCKV